MVVGALVATFTLSSMLQVTAAAHHKKASEPVVIEATKPLAKPSPGKERSVSQSRSAAESL
jgi:hypothetical protein